MNFLFVLIVACFSLAALVNSKEICYDGLGCFIDTNPFSGTPDRPLALLPENPEKISVRFVLYTRGNKEKGELISFDKIPAAFNPSAKTKFIIHGFLHNGLKRWVIDMKNSILNVENVNVIGVDWSSGNGFPYTQATANTQIVGAEIARLINKMIDTLGARAADFHLIGHSLGSHISGYAGSRVKGLGRITGLDPAGPYFENTHPIVRLDPSDAIFVDAIHSDGSSTLHLGLGLMQPVGHIDFYPNGGKVQPNCPQTSDKLLSAIFNLIQFDVQGIEEGLVCNHQAAVTYFQESIENNNNCYFTAYPCQSPEAFSRGECMVCPTGGCNRMGYWATPEKQQGSLYLSTENPLKPNTCLQEFKVKLVSSDKYSQARGVFKVYLKTASMETKARVIDDTKNTIKKGETMTRLLGNQEARVSGHIESLFVSYTRTSNFLTSWLYDDAWSFKYAEVFSGEDQLNFKFCPTADKIQSEFVEFKRC